MFPIPSPDRLLPSLNSLEIRSKESWRYRKPRATHRSSATAHSSDDNSLSTAMNDMKSPWGHQAPSIMFEPAFLNVEDKLLHDFENTPIPSYDDHHRAHAGHSHKTSSRRPGERDRKGRNTGQDPAKSGSGGGKDEKGRGTDAEPPRDGFRYPSGAPSQLPRVFGCPFYITDPFQYRECSNYRLRRLSDVSQHIERCHLLEEVELAAPGEAARKIRVGERTCTDPNSIKFYHATCRQEFHGSTAEDKCSRHASRCYNLTTIEDTGMLLPIEFRTLLSERDGVTGSVAKWYAMWRVCFPVTGFRTVPVSPYVQTIVPLPRGRAETIVRVTLGHWLIPELYNPILSQIMGELYPAEYITDPEVRAAVEYQQGLEYDLALQLHHS
ncbi:ankyrin 3 [Fusarium mexicanum]|uniref:Ankyrin 3 n=1 Tax=Fusarium mexicanum TaxID=751941 RepID=A0A8H5IBK6_9HYPO|nr:ankyrin 3 [Fusarium mexicanum]